MSAALYAIALQISAQPIAVAQFDLETRSGRLEMDASLRQLRDRCSVFSLQFPTLPPPEAMEPIIAARYATQPRTLIFGPPGLVSAYNQLVSPASLNSYNRRLHEAEALAYEHPGQTAIARGNYIAAVQQFYGRLGTICQSGSANWLIRQHYWSGAVTTPVTTALAEAAWNNRGQNTLQIGSATVP